MKIKETKTIPHPSGFGWGEYIQVRQLASGEAAAGAEIVSDDTPDTDWVSASLPFEPTSNTEPTNNTPPVINDAPAAIPPKEEGVSA